MINLQSPLSTMKIQKQHLDRIAIVYIRQSTIQQIERHQESTKLQYALASYAERLGWSKDRILIIDADLGISGSSSEGRPGFQRLVSEVGLNHVGIVLGMEISRLARSCKDWHHLLEICAIFDTLIGDAEGIYNPLQHNDRLLLGLKGAMSEAELYTIKTRMLEGKRAKAKRGELKKSVPIGYVIHPSGEVRKDSDELVQSTVELLFSLFNKIHTIQGVLRYLVKNNIKIPYRAQSGMDKGELKWRRPNRATLRDFFHNPIYAGAYAYGRRPTDVRKKKPGRPSTGRLLLKIEDCQVLIKDKLPAYISWEQYENNLKQMHANIVKQRGSVRKGSSLLSGLLICGLCNRRMNTHYFHNGSELRYVCNLERAVYGGNLCQSLRGKDLDEHVNDLVLEAMKPAALELSLKLAENLELERKQLQLYWLQRLEKAKYEVEKARRQYQLVDPENRLVARNLEKEWEEKLLAEANLKNEYDRLVFEQEQSIALSQAEKQSIMQLSSDIPLIWNSATTTINDKKEIIRQIIDKIIVTIPNYAEIVKICIHWAGGNQTESQFIRPVFRLEQLSYFPEWSECVMSMHKRGFTSREIAEGLNKKGWRPVRGGRFSHSDVRKFLVKKGLETPKKRYTIEKQENEWTLSELGSKLELSSYTLRHWLNKGILSRSRKVPPKVWLIHADEEEIARLRDLKEKHLKKYNR